MCLSVQKPPRHAAYLYPQGEKMNKLLRLFAVLAPVVLIVAACTVTISGSSTVGGSTTFNNMLVPSPASIALQGVSAYGVSMVVPYPSGGNQAGSYSFANVTSGSYTLSVTFSSPYATYFIASYIVDGGAPYPLSLSNHYNSFYGDYDWTATTSGLTVLGNGTIDLFIQH
jgi:hypothetical protein